MPAAAEPRPSRPTKSELAYRRAARAAMEGLRHRIAALERDRNAATGRADQAEREVRDLTRELRHERRRAEAAEARLKSAGIDG